MSTGDRRRGLGGRGLRQTAPFRCHSCIKDTRDQGTMKGYASHSSDHDTLHRSVPAAGLLAP